MQYIGFSSVALLVSVLRLSLYSHRVAGEHARGWLIFFGVAELCGQVPSSTHAPHGCIESGPAGCTREVETPLPSNSPHDHMILRVHLVGPHTGRWKRPCLQTTPNATRSCHTS